MQRIDTDTLMTISWNKYGNGIVLKKANNKLIIYIIIMYNYVYVLILIYKTMFVV